MKKKSEKWDNPEKIVVVVNVSVSVFSYGWVRVGGRGAGGEKKGEEWMIIITTK